MFTGDCLPGQNMCCVQHVGSSYPTPWGKLVKTQLFGEHHFKGFCENVVFLVFAANLFAEDQRFTVNINQ